MTSHAELSALAGWIASDAVDPGTIARLRRARPEAPALELFRILLARAPGAVQELERLDDVARVERVGAWSATLQAMATLRTLHAGVPLGRALAAAGVSEGRLLRVLRAPPSALAAEVRSVVAMVASRGQPVDVAEVGRLLLATDEAAEGTRQRIAQHYFAETGSSKRSEMES